MAIRDFALRACDVCARTWPSALPPSPPPPKKKKKKKKKILNLPLHSLSVMLPTCNHILNSWHDFMLPWIGGVNHVLPLIVRLCTVCMFAWWIQVYQISLSFHKQGLKIGVPFFNAHMYAHRRIRGGGVQSPTQYLASQPALQCLIAHPHCKNPVYSTACTSLAADFVHTLLLYCRMTPSHVLGIAISLVALHLCCNTCICSAA